MTSQKSKSPESIAMGIMIKSRKETGKLDPFYIHDHKIIFKEIIEAIKAERENNRLVLPEREISNHFAREKYKDKEWFNIRIQSFIEGVYWLKDEITRLNEGRVKPLELPGYANQCAHDVSPSDFDRGAEYGFNKCLNEIYEMNPYLKLDEK